MLLLAYWAAFLTNAAFDVYLEGPVGGVWFWCVFGVGAGACWVHRNHPEILNDEIPTLA